MESLDIFIKELLITLINQQAANQFYLVTDHPLDASIQLPSNVTNLVMPKSEHLLLRRYWMDVKLPLLLRKLRADLFVGVDAVASLTTKVPQCLVVQDIEFLLETNKDKRPIRSYYKRFMSRFLEKAKAVVVPSAFLKKGIERYYKIPVEKTVLLKYAVQKEFNPASYELKESVKALYAQGQEYFVYKGLIHADYNLVNLLKAFSLFKKRQQSSWKLVLAGTFKEGDNDFLTLLETYRYKEDVFVTGPLTVIEQAEVVSAAYALLSPCMAERVDVALIEAIQCEVPVLAAATATNKEIGSDGFLYFNPSEPNDIAEKLMQIYKDEKERRQLIEEAKQLSSNVLWEEAVNSLWQGMLLAANA